MKKCTLKKVQKGLAFSVTVITAVDYHFWGHVRQRILVELEVLHGFDVLNNIRGMMIIVFTVMVFNIRDKHDRESVAWSSTYIIIN